MHKHTQSRAKFFATMSGDAHLAEPGYLYTWQSHIMPTTHTHEHTQSKAKFFATMSGDAHLAGPGYLCTKQVLSHVQA